MDFTPPVTEVYPPLKIIDESEWVKDNKQPVCAHCKEVKFSLLNRRYVTCMMC